MNTREIIAKTLAESLRTDRFHHIVLHRTHDGRDEVVIGGYHFPTGHYPCVDLYDIVFYRDRVVYTREYGDDNTYLTYDYNDPNLIPAIVKHAKQEQAKCSEQV